MIDKKYINDYLHFGYIPKLGQVEKIRSILSPQCFYDREDMEARSEVELIQMGIDALNFVFDDLLENNINVGNNHLVPLSGGLDSRLILAALLDRVEAKKIHCVTFGSPRSFDFDIPEKIVKNTGVNLERIDCTQLDYSKEKLLKAVENGGKWTSIPDIYINQLSLKFGEDFNRWSGFLGGELAGSYGDLNSKFDDNIAAFVKYQQKSTKLKLTELNYNPLLSLNEPDDLAQFNITEFEKLFLFNRSASGSLPIMFPEKLIVQTPFLHPRWVDFILKIPYKHRKKSKLFEDILLSMFPDFMKLPSKNKAGLGLGEHSALNYFKNLVFLKARFELNKYVQNVKFPPIGVNYIDYKNGIKQIDSLNLVIKTACENLEDQKITPWLQPTQIFKKHMDNKEDYSKALLLLLGLDINLNTNK